MSATVTYKGATLTTATNQTRVLETEGTYLEDDITITDVTTIPTGTKNISITANGTTTEDVTSYASASITANVPNSYTASEEGKVVSNGSLVSQSSATYTENGTYDTTLVDDVTVDVSGGGGGGSWHADDGKTHLHINIYNDVYLTVNLCFTQTVNNGNTIDWGDGSTVETITGTSRQYLTHTYAVQGEYDITITNTSGYHSFGNPSTTSGYIFQQTGGNNSSSKYAQFNNILEKVELGKGWKIDEGRQFASCMRLQEVYVNTKPVQSTLASSIFQGCKALNLITGVDGWDSDITSCGSYALQKIGLPTAYIPPNVTVIPYGYMDSENVGLSTLIDIPLHEGITEIGNMAFRYCQYVPEIVIPSTVTRIQANAFSQNFGCHAVHLKPTTPPTLDNTNAFSTNNGGTYAQVMYVPQGCLSAYQSATNWSTFSSYMQEES